jgi:hypothetical protein
MARVRAVAFLAGPLLVLALVGCFAPPPDGLLAAALPPERVARRPAAALGAPGRHSGATFSTAAYWRKTAEKGPGSV